MRESEKTIKLLTAEHLACLTGRGIDIGSGPVPVVSNARPFDIEHGDANHILKYVSDLGTYDFVFSSHCLEHILDPKQALLDWWQLVKPGGFLFLIVPDEDLYEQGWWPSIFNHDHKHTFTISKSKSWSPVSINIMDLISNLPCQRGFTIQLMDNGYSRNQLVHGGISSHRAIRLMMLRKQWEARIPKISSLFSTLWKIFRLPCDQTHRGALAQILAVVRKDPEMQ